MIGDRNSCKPPIPPPEGARTTVYYLVVWRERQAGMNHRVLASVSNLLRLIETERDNDRRGVGCGPYDVYYVDLAALEVARYDLAPLEALLPPSAFPAVKKRAR